MKDDGRRRFLKHAALAGAGYSGVDVTKNGDDSTTDSFQLHEEQDLYIDDNPVDEDIMFRDIESWLRPRQQAGTYQVITLFNTDLEFYDIPVEEHLASYGLGKGDTLEFARLDANDGFSYSFERTFFDELRDVVVATEYALHKGERSYIHALGLDDENLDIVAEKHLKPQEYRLRVQGKNGGEIGYRVPGRYVNLHENPTTEDFNAWSNILSNPVYIQGAE